MKYTLIVYLVLTASFLIAQDTIIVFNNFNYKIGLKFSSQGSADKSQFTNTYYNVSGGGIQLIRQINKSKFSLESGIYYSSKAKPYHQQYYYYPNNYLNVIIIYSYLSLPINFRYDTKVVYVSGGVFFDYLVNKSNDYLINSIRDYGIDRKFNIGYNLTLGVEKQISSKINFFVEGVLNKTLSWAKVTEGHYLIDSNFKTTFNNYGVTVGLNYKFITSLK